MLKSLKVKGKTTLSTNSIAAKKTHFLCILRKSGLDDDNSIDDDVDGTLFRPDDDDDCV